MFTKTAQLWHNATPHPHWCGLPLLAIDGVFWRTSDTPVTNGAIVVLPQLGWKKMDETFW
ncbi:TPA: hypothetical protein HIF91_004825 [Escherichia coli]|nr:hypothetical protein [Escherichia coli]